MQGKEATGFPSLHVPSGEYEACADDESDSGDSVGDAPDQPAALIEEECQVESCPDDEDASGVDVAALEA